MTEESIFATVLELKTADERQAYLNQACAGNPELRAQVESLLAADADAGSFLNHPPAGLDATIESTAVDDTATSNGWAGGMPFLEPCDTPGRLGKLVGKAGEYEIIEVVGQGGMGAVLRAFETKLSRIVAVKVMAPELAANREAVKRFQREAQSAAAVHHDHVVTIHAVDESHRPPFIVMQFIEGQTLQQKLDREGALELRQILRIGSQMAAGLAAAHKHGLIHRDVKPANVLLENGVERVKITDFGLARAADDLDMTQTGVIAGTPQYMSPEQAKGEPIDTRSDLFSLGSVLYSMCTGRPAFRADNTMAVMRHVCDDAPRAIREVNREIPHWLEAIVNKLLAKNPAERFQSAAEVAELLGQHLAHLQNPAQVVRPATIFTPPPPKVVPTSGDRPADSSAAVVLIALGVLLGLPLLLAGIGVGAWFFYSKAGVEKTATYASPWMEVGKAKDKFSTEPEIEVREEDQPASIDSPPRAIAPFDAAQARTHQQEWAEYLGVPVEYETENGMIFRLIPPGEFLMGDTQEESDALVLALEQGGANDFDKFVARTSAPQHRVRISQPFYLAAHEVTVGQYRRFVEETKYVGSMEQLGIKRFDWTSSVAEPDPERRAVIGVSWDDAKAFCKWLSEKDKRTYDLPSEAQWEHACRAGTDTAWSFDSDAAALSEHAVFGRPSFWPAEVVGSKKPNPLGLYDMHGNADEWCLDWHDRDFYANSPVDDPVCLQNPNEKNSGRVVRGGTSHSAAWWTRSATRPWDFPATPNNPKGFRIAIVGDLAGIGKRRSPAASQQPAIIARSSRVFTGEMARDGDQNVFAIAWSPDGDLVATGHYGGSVAVWNLKSGEQVQALSGHTKTVNAIAFAPEGNLLATGGEDSEIRLWNTETWEEAGKLEGHTGWVNCLAFMKDGESLASVSWDFKNQEDNSIRRWNVKERTETSKLNEPQGHNTHAALSPNETLLAVANGAAGRVRLWDLAAGGPAHDFAGFPTQPVSVAFSRDGTRVAAGYMGRERDGGEWNDPENAVVRMWEVESGNLLQEFQGHAGPVMGLEFSPDDRRLLSLASGRHDASSAFVPSSDQSLRVWDVATGQELLRIEPPTRTNVARWTPDGSAVCSGTRLWAIPPSGQTESP